MMGSIGALDPVGTFARIECPALVVHSEGDTIPAEWSRMLTDVIPGADYALVENGSHFAHVEDASQLQDLVVPWLHKQLDQP